MGRRKGKQLKVKNFFLSFFWFFLFFI